MENVSSSPFLNFWHYAMIIGAIGMLALGVVLYILHQVRVSTIQDYKAKYDFITLNEVKKYKVVFLCFGIAAMMTINLYGMGKLLEIGVWFFVRLFISIAGGTLVVYVAFLILDYYYPTILNRKLKKWRYLPRTSSTGNSMRLLSEDEEDVHLEEGMRAEENVFSVDYDVWVDEKTGEIKVDKYPGHLQALKCNSCGFYTMKVVREEITLRPTKEAPGELIKNYQCSYCKSIRATAFNISNKEAEDYLNNSTGHKFKKNHNIDLIRVEILFNDTSKKYFEFQNVEQAQKFLDEYKLE